MIIVKIAPQACGDWHDKPLRWAVQGPGNELQKFSLKKDAQIYLRIRRKSSDEHSAINTFAKENWL